MEPLFDKDKEAAYWSARYQNGQTGWNIGYPSRPLKEYIDQLEDKTLSILIPGAGNAYEAEYLFQKGFRQVHVLDISPDPLKAFQQRVPDFPASQLICADFFEHQGKYDRVFEQTFFCSFEPSPQIRMAYAQKMHSLLNTNGCLVGLWFQHPLTGEGDKRPFGGSKREYLSYFTPFFDVRVFEDCYNSIPPRQGNEWFVIMQKN